MISPLAYIHPEAKIGENVEIGPFVFIDKNVVIGDNNTIMPNANILYGSRIGNGNTIFPGAVIGAIPQDLKFRGEETTAEIGDNNTIRGINTAPLMMALSSMIISPAILVALPMIQPLPMMASCATCTPSINRLLLPTTVLPLAAVPRLMVTFSRMVLL